MSLKEPGGNSGSGAGYLKVQRHPRNAVISFGFALVTAAAAFSADLTVPSIAQSQLAGYKAPAKQVRHTQPQDGWLYTAATPPAFDPTITVAPIEQSKTVGYRARARWERQTEQPAVYDLLGTYAPATSVESSRPTRKSWRNADQPQDGWLETATHEWAVERTPYSLDQRMDAPKNRRRPVEQGQDGWLYTASTPTFDPATFRDIVSERSPDRHSLKYRYDGYPATDWIYQNLPVVDTWTEAKFQNNSGDRTPLRKALTFRYPPASSGFSTDGSTPPAGDTWSLEKFQNNTGERTADRKALRYRYANYPQTDWVYQNLPVPDVWSVEKFQSVQSERLRDRRKYDPRLVFHKFPFALLDARVVMPAIDQLSNSERSAPRRGKPIVTPDSYGWLYTNIPTPFDPQLLVHSSDDRLRDRYKKVPQLDQPAQDWIYTSIPPFDPQYLVQVSAPQRMANRRTLDVRLPQFYNDMAWLRDVLSLPDPTIAHNLLIDVDTGEIWMRLNATSPYIIKVT